MRVVIDEDIPRALTPLFGSDSHRVDHVDDLGLRGLTNGALLAAIDGRADILVTGDTNLGYQQDLRRFDVAVILIHPGRLVIDRIRALIPEAVAAFETAPRKAVTVIGDPVRRGRT